MEQNMNLYYIFYQVASEGNITGASNRLFISQPAISKAIQKLEEQLGVALFMRSSRGVTLTKEGTMLFHQAESAFQAIEYGEKQIKLLKDTESWQLTIGVSSTLCKYVLLPYLKGYMNSHPHVRISIQCQSSLDTASLLQKGAIDIGLIGDIPLNQSLEFKSFMKIQDSFVATNKYLNSQRCCISDVKELFRYATVMMLDKENITRQYVDKFLQEQHLDITGLMEVSSMDLGIEFAKTDLGIACVIKEFVEKELKNGQLHELQLPILIPSRNIGFSYRKIAQSNVSVSSFLEYIFKT